MSGGDDFNLRLEGIHKSVKVPTKPKPVAAPKPAPKVKAKAKAKPKAAPAAKKESPPPAAETAVAPPAILPESPGQISNEFPNEEPQLLAETVPAAEATKEEPGQTTIDKTLFRKHKAKNTFNSVFPAYGLNLKTNAFLSETKQMSKDLEKAEPIDKTYHMKLDPIKRYTEEMLKAANMRGDKK